MLMRFSVGNFMSFGYKTDHEGNIAASEMLMYAGRSEQFKNRIIHVRKRKILKFSAVYGANASGKSNLIHAIDFGKRVVLSGLNVKASKGKYCRNTESNKNKPSLFEYEISIGDRCFAYGFTVNLYQNRVLTEWLSELTDDDENIIFERDAVNSEYYFDENLFSEESAVQQFHFYMKDSNQIKETLLLHELGRRKLDGKEYALFTEIYEWFQKKLVIIYPDTKLAKGYFRFRSDNEKLVKLLKYLDTGITGYKMQELDETAFRKYFIDQSIADELLENDEEKKKLTVSIGQYQDVLFQIINYGNETSKISKLLFQHGADESQYEYGEESDGTQRLIELVEIILNDEEGKTFVIDELDRSLHPMMTIKFVDTFLHFSEKTDNQLIITTHESQLMDLNLLRRDEIWFAEREFDNTTSLYSLEKFKARYDKVVMKDYLNGRYGAVPVFKDFDYVNFSNNID